MRGGAHEPLSDADITGNTLPTAFGGFDKARAARLLSALEGFAAAGRWISRRQELEKDSA